MAVSAGAQDLAYRMAASDYRMDYADTRTLAFELDNISFFNNFQKNIHSLIPSHSARFWSTSRGHKRTIKTIKINSNINIFCQSIHCLVYPLLFWI